MEPENTTPAQSTPTLSVPTHPVPTQIVACPNGPLLVRGPAELVTADGEPVTRNRRTVALCRCGVSTIKPFCDGTHKAIGFRTEPVEPDPGR